MKKFYPLFYISFFLFLLSCRKKEVQQEAIPNLKAVEVQEKQVPLYKEFVGQVYGKADIPIRARVDGFVEKIHFREGLTVSKGQLLYSIDDHPFRLSVSREESMLSEAEVNRVNAENDLARIAPLADINAISKRDLDAAMARRDASEEAVKAAEANLNLAKVNLGYANIYAPISGIIGKTKAKEGEYVGKSPNPVILNTISKIDSVVVEFFLNEKDYIAFYKQLMQDGEAGLNRISHPLELYLADGEKFPYTGKITFLDRNVDPGTGTILVQSIFPNPDGLIRPGQFGKVKSIVTLLEQALVVPQRCVVELQGFYNVFTVGSDGLVTQKRVELLDEYQDMFVIKSGLEKGEKVLLEGLMAVQSGQKVSPELVSFNPVNQ
ncbi:efflux RND transporter periplasmic adaptor subunit [Cyclobacterium plantarum]|uniref:Efflux RND transporter periplasmic adaptor subunit n=1 Tax=Cyclobacterium plantarum TaxID=2716263 RepID=A0ABX0H627_9BACT|nr:efflux RND transporter periplasmic adaptor subunit [Cyclobacterium plantarum]NHE55774.1 efflux RND transporter periplasmic adaptor subunit [Cyclobacterium plantarum]